MDIAKHIVGFACLAFSIIGFIEVGFSLIKIQTYNLGRVIIYSLLFGIGMGLI